MDSERFSVLEGLLARPAAAPEAAPGAAPETAADTGPDAGPETETTETGAEAEAEIAAETGDSGANTPEPAGFMDIPAPVTGDPRVDEAVAGLATLGGQPLEEHPPVLEGVHDTLRGLLGELGEPGKPGRPGQQGELGSDR